MKNKRVKSKIFHYYFFPKNRKAFLLAEETLKIVIAVICIAFLVYFLMSLYLKNQESKNLEFAKATLEKIIHDADFGETEIYNPSSSDKVPGGWTLVSFRIESAPDLCSKFGWQNCLCICGKSPLPLTNIAEDCDDEGVCLETDLTVNGEIKIENPPLKLNINEKVISKNGA